MTTQFIQLEADPQIIALTGSLVRERVGLLGSFVARWRNDVGATVLVPFDHFYTGRLPTTEDYDWPAISLIVGSSFQRYRSDVAEGVRRTVTVHIFVDVDKLEEGEVIAEKVRRIYANQSWCYDGGVVTDVLDSGPASCRQHNEPTFQAWELVRTLTLCIEVPRVDQPYCRPCHPTGSHSSVANSSQSRSSRASITQ